MKRIFPATFLAPLSILSDQNQLTKTKEKAMATPSTASTDFFEVQALQLELQASFATQVQARLAEAEAIKSRTAPDADAPKSQPLPEMSSRSGAPVARSSAGPNLIVGTNGDDDITGTLINDEIRGFNGNDKMRGDNGDDIIKAGNGDDVMSGDHVPSRTTQSNDTLYGQNGNDQIFGRIGDDKLYGQNGNDQMFGGSGADRLIGGSGNDQLFGGVVSGDASFNTGAEGRNVLVGGSGNDFVEGGTQRDIIWGTDVNAKGAGEFDILIGGGGNDLFILGDRNTAYYTQGGPNQDFGLIVDFSASEGDRIRLHGNASQYVIGYNSADNSTFIAYTANSPFELVGSIAGQDLSGVGTSSNIFQYVS